MSAQRPQSESPERTAGGGPDATQHLAAGGGTDATVAMAASAAVISSSEPRAPVPGELPALPPGLARYKLVRLLGQGGMGSVYLAQDAQLNRQVALKLPHFTLGSTGNDFRERFLREARAAAALSHPNICPLYDAGQADNLCYLTMAYVPGQSLAEAIDDGVALPAEDATRLVLKLAQALEHAHSQGIVHRDLKPGNVMLDGKGEPVIMDFGLARLLTRPDEAQLTQSGDVLGTPAFMAPEQALGELNQIGPPTDIYALGVILYRLLTGRLPYEGSAISALIKAIQQPPTPPSQYVPGLDRKLEWICLRAMAKTPGERFATMGTLATALAEVLESGRSLAGGPATKEATPLPVVADVSPLAGPEKPSRHDSYPSAYPPRPRTSWWSWSIGCLVAVAMVVGMVGAVGWMVWKAVDSTIGWIGDLQSDNQVWQEVARFWQPPPAGTRGEPLFPAEFAAFKRTRFDDQALVPDMQIDIAGQHAVYEGPSGPIDLYVYAATQPQADTLFARAKRAISPGDSTTETGLGTGSGSSNGRLFHYSSGTPAGPMLRASLPAMNGEPADYCFMWWNRDWLFLARSQSDTEVDDFLKDYLRNVGTVSSGSTPAESRPAEKEK